VHSAISSDTHNFAKNSSATPPRGCQPKRWNLDRKGGSIFLQQWSLRIAQRVLSKLTHSSGAAHIAPRKDRSTANVFPWQRWWDWMLRVYLEMERKLIYPGGISCADLGMHSRFIGWQLHLFLHHCRRWHEFIFAPLNWLWLFPRLQKRPKHHVCVWQMSFTGSFYFQIKFVAQKNSIELHNLSECIWQRALYWQISHSLTD
jgi:hypothetical protein